MAHVERNRRWTAGAGSEWAMLVIAGLATVTLAIAGARDRIGLGALGVLGIGILAAMAWYLLVRRRGVVPAFVGAVFGSVGFIMIADSWWSLSVPLTPLVLGLPRAGHPGIRVATVGIVLAFAVGVLLVE